MSHLAANRNHVWSDIVLIILFLAGIYLPIGDNLLRLDHTQPPVEKRTLAPLPKTKLGLETLADLREEWEAYYNDHFGFRNRLIRLHNYVKTQWLHTSPSSKVVLGKDGFLFYTGDDAIEYYRSVRPFTLRDLAHCQLVLEERQDWLMARGAHFLVVIAPSKETIYPEYMPARMNRVRSESRLDQLLAHLAAHSDIAILDLRRPLLNAKTQIRVYDRTDTHWNGYGAYVAYQEIMSRVARWLPQAQPVPLSAFQLRSSLGPPGDLAELLGMEHVLTEEHISLLPLSPRAAIRVDPGELLRLPFAQITQPIVRERPGPHLPRAVVLRDSFAIRLIPLLSEHFSRVVYLWEYRFDLPVIEHEQPDVVILEIAERSLMLPATFPTNDPPVRKPPTSRQGIGLPW